MTRERERLHGNLSTVEYFTFGFGTRCNASTVGFAVSIVRRRFDVKT